MRRQQRVGTARSVDGTGSLNEHATHQQPPQPPQPVLNPNLLHQATETDQFQPLYGEKAHYPAAFHQPQSPSIEQHSSNYAPVVDGIPQDRLSYEVNEQPNTRQPNSPPSFPPKLSIDTSRHPPNKLVVPVVPDANPLQSPKLSYFPPPPTPGPVDLVAYHRPGQISHPNIEIKGGTWRHGLCGCSSIKTCCLGILCPCILYGRTQYRLSMKSNRKDPTNMLGYETCNGSCTAMAVLCGCQWLLATIQHTRTRKAYEIQGSIASDCVRATCCMCCTLIQDENEIREREEEREKASRASGAPFVSPYLAPVPMSYPPHPT